MFTHVRAWLLKHKLLRLLLSYAAAGLTILATKLLLGPFEPGLEIQLIALLYLLPVMISTVLWGFIPGILAGISAFLAFNYYYIQPYRTFEVYQTRDLITLVIFLIVAVVLSQLIGQARRGMHLARSREWEATRMYELISALAGLQDINTVAHRLASHTLETFRFDGVTVSVDQQVNVPAASVISPEVDPELMEASPQTVIPLLTARSSEGEMCIWFTRPGLSPQESRLLEAYASQGALSIERIRLVQGENKARLLEETNLLKSSLLNSVSHELRSPLAAIKASVSSLRTGMVDWNIAARQELLSTIEEETDHLNLLVGNLLDMSRIESGALKPNRRWNEIAEIAMGVVTKMRKQLEEHHLELDFPEDLPLVPTDYVMIEQVFVNLISNSIKYAPKGSTISLSAFKESDHLFTQISNEGPPVAEENLEAIFDKFYRVTQADQVTGTGLGLSICKGIIEEHGGKIWAENQPGRFVFQFKLPLTMNGNFPEVPKEAGDG